METERVPGGKYSTTQNSEHKESENRDGEQAICQSKQKEWRAYNLNKRNETKET